ncbi:MAG: ribonuclease HII [Candidatus Micrarchaeota archaeon]|nr:ribonuclease HII [Candidatus Micrarchaeota archaeon]
MIIAGGDEAGRGAVLGPLTVSIVSIKKSREARLASIGVRDSKMLTPKKRSFLYDEINSLAEDVRIYKITNDEIDKAIATGMSLNSLEALNFARLIDSLNSEPDRIILDSPDVIPERFGLRVGLFSKRNLKIKGLNAQSVQPKASTGEKPNKQMTVIAEHKADLRYPVVSAASIIAKVERDAEIERISSRLGLDIGTGYPSDKTTTDAILTNLKNEKFAKFIRQRWKTLQLIRQLKIDTFIK